MKSKERKKTLIFSFFFLVLEHCVLIELLKKDGLNSTPLNMEQKAATKMAVTAIAVRESK